MDLRSLVGYYQERTEKKEEQAPPPADLPSVPAGFWIPPSQVSYYHPSYYPYYQPPAAADGNSNLTDEQQQNSLVQTVEKQEEAKQEESTIQQVSEENPKKRKIDVDQGASEAAAASADGSEQATTVGPTIGPESAKKVKTAESAEAANEEALDAKEKTEKQKKENQEDEEINIFHGTELYDYQGRTYLDPPSYLRNVPHECFMPKRAIHQWRNGSTKTSKDKKKKKNKNKAFQKHKNKNIPQGKATIIKGADKKGQENVNGVSAIRLFPRYGHILLSANMDGSVKIYDLYNDKRCLRTMIGHKKAIRDITFNHDGTNFLTASFDRSLKLWDTETGQCVGRFSNRKIPFCVRYPPQASEQHNFLCGCSDNRLYQWDTRTETVVQEYNYHLGPINSICFIDDGRRFISSSDDKSLRVWEYGIPVEIKEIREPYLHSMPALAHHPLDPWMVAQSMDNQILVISAKEKFRIHKKKRFLGHLVAGYACQPNFSPDGNYLISGDSSGSLFIWDWKTHRLLNKLPGHDRVLIGCEWHPIEPSRVVTCSWDGSIKYWD